MKLFLSLLTITMLATSCLQDSNESIGNEILLDLCQNEVISRDDGTIITQFVTAPISVEKDKEVAIGLSSNNVSMYISLAIRYFHNYTPITGELSIRTKSNNIFSLPLIETQKALIDGFEMAMGVYELDEASISKLKDSDLLTISIVMGKDSLISTSECKENINVLKKQLSCFHIAKDESTEVGFDSTANNQEKYNGQIHISSKYGYQITIPNGFEIRQASGKNIDTKLVDKFGSSILVNVSQRRSEEYSINGHSYSTDYFKQLYNQYSPQTEVIRGKEIFVDGAEAFLLQYLDKKSSLMALEATFFKNDKTYLITASCPKGAFESAEPLFLFILQSFKFK